MPVYFFNSLPNDEYSNLLILAAFFKNSFSGKPSSLPFPHDKAEILAVCPSKFH